MIEIPSKDNRNLYQENETSILGTLDSSFNLDLTSNKGAIRVNRSKKVFDNTDDEDFGVPIAICLFDHDNDLTSDYIVMTGTDTTVDGGIFIGGADPNDTLTQDTTTNTPTTIIRDRADMRVFNDQLWIVNGINLLRLPKGGNWTSVSGSLTNGEHHTCVMGNRMYFTNNRVTVLSVNTSNVVATTTGTLDLSGFDNVYITFIIAGNDRVWVGTVNKAGGNGSIFEWDGETEDTPTRRYELDSIGALAGVMKDGIPYVMDTEGYLRAFNGASFQKIARLPVDENRSLFNPDQLFSSTLDDRARYIHPNGMVVINGDIHMLIRGSYEDGLSTLDTKFLSGVYKYTPENGLHHTNSTSYSDVGGTTTTDHGQTKIAVVGALEQALAGGTSTDRNGTYMFGAKHYTDDTNIEYGLFIDDSIDTTQKYGIAELPIIFASNIQDTWQKLYVVCKDLLDSSDEIVVKYITKADTETQFAFSWSSENRILTNTDLSAYAEGDEIQVIQGTGSPKTAHISSITQVGGGYSILLDETFSGASGNSTGVARKWIKLGSLTQSNDDLRYKGLTLIENNTSSWIKFKICMQFKGKDEIYKFVVVNKTNIRE